jgi:hypothetical protein
MGYELVNEIEEMNNPRDITDELEEVEEEVEEEEEAVGEEATGEENEKPSGEANEGEEQGEEKDELTLLKEENERLRATLSENAERKKTGGEESAENTSVEPITFDDEFISEDDDIDSIFGDRESSNKFLKNFAEKVASNVQQKTIENVLKSIPDIVKTNVTVQQNLQKMADKFYSENEDLLPYKSIVSDIAESVISENSDWSFEDVLTETGKRAREKLSLGIVAQNKKSKQEDKLKRFPKAPNNRRRVVDKKRKNEMLEQIDQMNAALQ